jgi:hypothetical protein
MAGLNCYHPAAVPYTILKSERSLPTSIFAPSLLFGSQLPVRTSPLPSSRSGRTPPPHRWQHHAGAGSKRPPRRGSQQRCYFMNLLEARCGDKNGINGSHTRTAFTIVRYMASWCATLPRDAVACLSTATHVQLLICFLLFLSIFFASRSVVASVIFFSFQVFS